ncbi:hypothetical protein E8E11_003610 [Didymella keratinophila]|nr:hypothetical protein E8E11_003610 [Didymella keratinophila]
MTQLIEISKTMSSPAISGIPSFLTTLPAEVRNCVYEVLFERKKHVLLHNADAYNPRHSDQADYEDNDQFREALRTYDEDLDRNMLRDEDFKHGFGGELALLLNCHDPEDGDSDSDSNSDDNTSSDDNDDNQHSDTNDADVDVEEGDARLHERTKLLDNFLVNLSTYDVLNLKPYRHFGWVLKEVFVPLLSPGEVAQVDADVDVLFDCSGEEYFREYTVP